MFRLLGRMDLGLCAAVVSSQLIGCGNPYRLAPVEGRITCQGTPAAGGEVVFQPLDAPEQTGRPKGHPGTSSRASVGKDGRFVLTFDGKARGNGALIGPHQVLFRMPPTKRPTLTADDRAVMSPEEIRALEWELRSRPVYPLLPCGANLTPSQVEVKPGKNEFEFTLQPK